MYPNSNPGGLMLSTLSLNHRSSAQSDNTESLRVSWEKTFYFFETW